jgi:hypothetical protein
MVIGLGHYSRTGKDTLCKAILEEAQTRDIRATRLSFADKLKDISHQLYGWAGLREAEVYDRRPELRDIPLEPIGLTPVEIWIEVGNKMRDVYGRTWVDLVRSQIPQWDLVVITDVRFPNEVDMIKSFPQSLLCKVVRPGVRPRNSISDQSLYNVDWYDTTFNNSGGFDKVGREAKLLLDVMLHGRNNHPRSFQLYLNDMRERVGGELI